MNVTDEYARAGVSRPRRAMYSMQLSAMVAAMFVGVGCASGLKPAVDGSAPSGAAKTSIWGYVLTVKGTDTVRVAGAEVRTEPISDVVLTDSVGYWEIKEGIEKDRYRVLAKFEGVTGQVQRVDLKPGEGNRVLVLLGAENTAWPPTIMLDNKSVTIPAGVPIRREFE